MALCNVCTMFTSKMKFGVELMMRNGVTSVTKSPAVQFSFLIISFGRGVNDASNVLLLQSREDGSVHKSLYFSLALSLLFLFLSLSPITLRQNSEYNCGYRMCTPERSCLYMNLFQNILATSMTCHCHEGIFLNVLDCHLEYHIVLSLEVQATKRKIIL